MVSCLGVPPLHSLLLQLIGGNYHSAVQTQVFHVQFENAFESVCHRQWPFFTPIK